MNLKKKKYSKINNNYLFYCVWISIFEFINVRFGQSNCVQSFELGKIMKEKFKNVTIERIDIN